MTRVNRNQVWGPGGVLLSETLVTVSDEDIERETSPERLRIIISTLRAWSADAKTVYADWPNKTAAQKDAVNREVVQRLGRLCDGLIDVLLYLTLDR